MSLKEKIREQAKTLAQLGRKCISLNRMCKDCTGDCEFEGTPTFLGRFVSVDVVSGLLDKAIAQIEAKAFRRGVNYWENVVWFDDVRKILLGAEGETKK